MPENAQPHAVIPAADLQLSAQNPQWRVFAAAAPGASLVARPLRVIEAAGIYVDLSMQRHSSALAQAGLALLQARDVLGARAALFAPGAPDAAHGRYPVLRAGYGAHPEEQCDIEVEIEYARMLEFVRELDRGGACPAVLYLGGGAGQWALRLALQAFGGPAQRRQLRFVSGGDAAALHEALAGLDPRRTLVVAASRGFEPSETLDNARAAIDWLRRAGIDDVSAHLVAVTGNESAARALGVAAARVFRLPSWLQSRHELWSVGALPVALALGVDMLKALRSGAAAMDQHFLQAAPAVNAPMQMALAAVANTSAMHWPTHALAVYSARLAALPACVQQLEMTLAGRAPASLPAYPVVWSPAGAPGPGAFFEWLHRAPAGAPVDFIAGLDEYPASPPAHRALLANCLAQREALLRGLPAGPGQPAAGGGRPSTLVVLRQVDPRAVGALLALYEHKAFVQAALWGAALGGADQAQACQRLAQDIARQLAVPPAAGPVDWGHDSSTAFWIDRYREQGGAGAAAGRTA
ncbi:glucose-6-phosphate isomerase [Bordetella bronchiseptica MBORD635]|uniref:glucose-6-phosphate isomerase n=1 Tax=Bordetella bronchiseptica TaxID=518 RepID=UPI000461FB31|nr:glucose-6-phosphate isomerase [Bordetella bronchiseptica]KDC74641.1 glucose-6-phosphate isomerase [Bordetella bronchiseptica MBORD635]